MHINVNNTVKKTKSKSKNVSSSEEEELMQLARKYWSVIQCKKTDHSNNLKKKECWKKLNMNSMQPEYYCLSEVLRTKLENILRRTRWKGSACRKYDTDTGGGPPKYDRFEPAEKTALALLGPRAEVLPNSWCDDEFETKLIA